MKKYFLCLGMVFLLFCNSSSAEEKKAEKKLAPITILEIVERGVQGHLGTKLGDVVEISGVVIENKSRAKAYVSEPYFFMITSTNKNKLKRPVTFSNSDFHVTFKEKRKRRIGEKFRCVGYESGEFRGTPPEAMKKLYDMPFTSLGYHFNSKFLGKEIVEVASKASHAQK